MLSRISIALVVCVTAVFAVCAAALPQSAQAPSASQSTATAPVARPTATAPVARPVLAASKARAQAAPPTSFEHHTLTGLVLDEKGKPVKGATVTLVDPDTNFKAPPVKTDKNGRFVFENLTTSSYKLQATQGDHKSDTADVAIGSESMVHKNLVLK